MAMILHHEGVYNLWSTVCDEPLYTSGFGLDDLHAIIKEESGKSGLNQLPHRLERAHKIGSSSGLGETLEDLIKTYIRNHKDYTRESFIKEFLTL